jgi:hypothetical protein
MHLSDDPRDPASLFSLMRRAVGRLRLPFRVVDSAQLTSAAATGDGVIVVKRGLRCRRRDAQRIVLHEVEGHALPRYRARCEPCGLFRVGCRGGADDEEGRALLLERRAGLLGGRRRVELARRHLAALAVRRGASFVETVDLLREHGAPLPDAVLVSARCHRAGGLAREIVYLPALARVGAAFESDPGLEGWVAREPPHALALPRAA